MRSPREAEGEGGGDALRRGGRALPTVVLPILVVVGLALLWGEHLRARSLRAGAAQLPPGASCDPVRMLRPEASATPRSSRTFSKEATAGAMVREGPPTMRGLDPQRTNRSPFRAPRRPHISFGIDLGAPIAVAPIEVSLPPGPDGIREARFVVATLAGEVVFLDGEGKERARTSLGERVYGSPAVFGSLVWLGVDRGIVVGLDPSSGKIVRKLRLQDDQHDADTAILPLDDRLVFAAGPLVYGVRGDGTFVFRQPRPRKIYGSAAALRGGSGARPGFVVSGQDDAATFFDANGAVVGRAPLGADADGSPAVGDDGTVFVGTDEPAVWALTPPATATTAGAAAGPGTGGAGGADERALPEVAVRFHRVLDGGAGYVRGALSVARDGTVLVSTYGPAPCVLGLDPLTGAERFRHGVAGTGSREYGIHGAPVELADGVLLFGGPDDRVHALSPAGDPLWTVEAGGDVDGTVVPIADGSFLVATSVGRFLRIDDAP